MTGLGDPVSGLGGAAERVLGVLGRATAGPLIIRAVVFGAGFAALTLAVPLPLWQPRLAGVAVLLALPAVIRPGSAWVSAVEYLAVLGWIGATLAARYEIPPAQLAGLAVALYLHHSAAALAAATPLDAALAPDVLRGWAVRTGLVLAVSVGLGLVVLGLPGLLGRSGTVLAPVLGLVALLTAGYTLTRLARHSR